MKADGGRDSQVLGQLGQLVAVVGTPVAVVYALGLLAIVGDLRFVEPTSQRLGILAAWNAAGLVDREILLGVGTIIFVPSLIVAILF
jgi:hypothetical protein